jgi:hypothetical protein
MKKTLTAVAITAALGIGLAGTAGAASVSQLISQYGSFLWEDDDIEWQQVDANNNGLLDVGDTLKGVVKILQIKNVGGPGSQLLTPLVGNTSVTGVFETEVKAISNVVAGFGDFTFGPVGGATGTIFDFYENAAVDNLSDIFNCGSRAACEGAASNGSNILSLGFTGDVDEYWVATGAPLNPDLTGIPTDQALGNFQFGLGVTASSIGAFEVPLPVTAPTFGDGSGDDLVGWNGSGSVLGAQGIGADATATSDTDFASTKVPAPSALLLIGLGLVALGATKRRKG